MRKLIAGMKMSLDGKIEGPGGFADWVDSWAEEYGLTDQIDACVLGGRMYPGYEQYWSAMLENGAEKELPMTGKVPTSAELQWARFASRTPHYVLSNSLQSVAWPHSKILHSLDEVAALKKDPGRHIYLMGGAQVTLASLQAGLLDELHLFVYPLLAGPGKPLFANIETRRGLNLESAQGMPDGRVKLRYTLV